MRFFLEELLKREAGEWEIDSSMKVKREEKVKGVSMNMLVIIEN